MPDVRRIFQALASEVIRKGLVDPRGKSDHELRFELFQRLQQEADAEIIHFAHDHTGTLLHHATLCRETGEIHLSCLIYATWSEHWLNGLIATAAERRQTEQDEIAQMIRDVPLRGKLGWLLNLLGLPAVDAEHRNAILRLMDLRNQYAHYKWIGRHEDHERREAEDVGRAVHAFPSTVNYLLAYEDDQIYAGKSKWVRNNFSMPQE